MADVTHLATRATAIARDIEDLARKVAEIVPKSANILTDLRQTAHAMADIADELDDQE